MIRQNRQKSSFSKIHPSLHLHGVSHVDLFFMRMKISIKVSAKENEILERKVLQIVEIYISYRLTKIIIIMKFQNTKVNFIRCNSKRSTFSFIWHKLITLVAWNICKFDSIFIPNFNFSGQFVLKFIVNFYKFHVFETLLKNSRENSA